MRNTAERNISAMSVKWSSKELANPRVLSVIYDGEPITFKFVGLNYRKFNNGKFIIEFVLTVGIFCIFRREIKHGE